MKRLLSIKALRHIPVLLRPNNGRWQAIRTNCVSVLILDTGIDADHTARPVCVDTKPFVDAMALRPSTITVSGDTVMVGSIALPTTDPADYPPIPEPTIPLTPVSADDLRITVLSCDTDTTVPVRNSIHIVDGRMEATDMKRATIVQSPTPPGDYLVPAIAVKLLSKKSTHFGIAQSDTHLTISDGTDTLIHRRIEGKTPDIRRCINRDNAPICTLQSSDLAAALAVAKTNTRLDAILIAPDGAVYGASTGTTVQATTHNADHPPAELNYSYVADACRSIEGSITMHGNGRNTYPVVFTDADKRITVIMAIVDTGIERPSTLSSLECKPASKPRKSRPIADAIEIVPGHVWASPAMVSEVTEALRKWGMIP